MSRIPRPGVVCPSVDAREKGGNVEKGENVENVETGEKENATIDGAPTVAATKLDQTWSPPPARPLATVDTNTKSTKRCVMGDEEQAARNTKQKVDDDSAAPLPFGATLADTTTAAMTAVTTATTAMTTAMTTATTTASRSRQGQGPAPHHIETRGGRQTDRQATNGIPRQRHPGAPLVSTTPHEHESNDLRQITDASTEQPPETRHDAEDRRRTTFPDINSRRAVDPGRPDRPTNVPLAPVYSMIRRAYIWSLKQYPSATCQSDWT